MSTLSPYPSPDDREAELERLTIEAGGQLESIGHSVEGRPIRAARLLATSPTEDRVLLCANIHGVEYIAAKVALAFIECAGEGGPMSELRKRAEIWVVPSLNPDAYARTWTRNGEGRLDELRKNANGVDLNRNFAMPAPQRKVWLSFGGFRTGSRDRGNAFYRGAEPFSEPETDCVRRLLESRPFRVGANLHSFMGSVIPPFVTDGSDAAAYRRLHRAFRDAQPSSRYFRLAGRHFDIFTGEQEDYQHHVHRMWSVCIECFSIPASYSQSLVSRSLFWRFNPRDPRKWTDNDVPGLIAYFLAALQLGRPAGMATASTPVDD